MRKEKTPAGVAPETGAGKARCDNVPSYTENRANTLAAVFEFPPTWRPICPNCGSPVRSDGGDVEHPICRAKRMMSSWRQWKLELKAQRIADDCRILDERRARQLAKVRS